MSNFSILKRIIGNRDVKNGSLLAFAHVLTLMLGLGTTIVWTRWMPIEIFGQFKVVMGAISFAGAFCLLGTGQAALMSASSEADGNLLGLIRKKFQGNLVGVSLLLIGASYYYWMRQDTVTLAAGLVAAALLFPLYNTSDVWSGWLNGKAQFIRLATGRLLASVLAFFAALIIVLFYVRVVWLAIAILLVILSLQNVYMLGGALRLRANERSDNEIIRFGWHANYALGFTSILALDVVFLEYVHSVEEVALYAVALVLPGLLKTVFGIIGQVVAPKIYATKSPQELWVIFKRKFYWLTLVFIICGVAGFFIIPLVIPTLFSERYAASADYAKWLWLTISCVGSFTYLGSALLATRREIYLYIPNIGHPIALMVLYFLLVDFGAAGMVFAKCISALLLAGYYGAAFCVYLIRGVQTSA